MTVPALLSTSLNLLRLSIQLAQGFLDGNGLTAGPLETDSSALSALWGH